jgi:MYXO-CTERM domain-containing protein
MKSSASLFAFALATSLATFAATASADQADKDACVGLAEGDACTRGDGEPGFCAWDDTDPVLTCEDATSSSSSSSSSGCDDDSDPDCEDITNIDIGCSSSGNAPGSLWGLVGVAAALVTGRRRSLRA